MALKILVVSDHCPSCRIVEEYLTKFGFADRFRIVNVESSEGQMLMEKLDLRGVPDCVLVDNEKKIVRRCSEQEWKEMLKGK